jgi:membrane-associated phospholipid phosphatase
MTDIKTNYFAELISYTIHPLILSPLTFIMLYIWGSQPDYSSFPHLIMIVLAISIIPFSYVLRMKKNGEIDNIDIPERKQRQKPFIKGTILFLMTAILLILSRGPQNFTSIMLIYTINTGLATLITKFWKISVHGIAFGIPVATFGMLISKKYFYFSSLLPLLIYSRVKLKAHTVSQVIAGFALGFLLTVIQIKFVWPDLV